MEKKKLKNFNKKREEGGKGGVWKEDTILKIFNSGYYLRDRTISKATVFQCSVSKTPMKKFLSVQVCDPMVSLK